MMALGREAQAKSTNFRPIQNNSGLSQGQFPSAGDILRVSNCLPSAVGPGQEDTMSTTTEFTIVAVVIAALLGAAFHLNRAQTFAPVTAVYAAVPAVTFVVEPITTGSVRH
jgi:hypothetical protein